MSDLEVVFSVVIGCVVYDFSKWVWKRREWIVARYYEIVCVILEDVEWVWKKIRKK